METALLSPADALEHRIAATVADPKEIRRDRESGDYGMYWRGELIGYRRTYHDAEIELDRHVYEALSKGN